MTIAPDEILSSGAIVRFGEIGMNPKTKSILSKSPYSMREWRKAADEVEKEMDGTDMTDKCPSWEEMAKSRGQTIPQEAVKMGATVTLDSPSRENTPSEGGAPDIQTRLEILKILFSSPYIGPDHGFTTKQVENWVKTGEGVGIVFVEWSK